MQNEIWRLNEREYKYKQFQAGFVNGQKNKGYWKWLWTVTYTSPVCAYGLAEDIRPGTSFKTAICFTNCGLTFDLQRETSTETCLTGPVISQIQPKETAVWLREVILASWTSYTGETDSIQGQACLKNRLPTVDPYNGIMAFVESFRKQWRPTEKIICLRILRTANNSWDFFILNRTCN